VVPSVLDPSPDVPTAVSAVVSGSVGRLSWETFSASGSLTEGARRVAYFTLYPRDAFWIWPVFASWVNRVETLPGLRFRALGDITSGTPGVLGEELDDARLDVALTAAGSSTPLARTPSSRAAHGASRSDGDGATVVGVELVDLLIKPRQMFLDFSTFRLKGVDDLLNTRQRRLLIKRGLFEHHARRNLRCRASRGAETVIRSQRRVPAGSTNLSGGREGASRPPLSREPCSPRVEAEATADSGSPAWLMIHAMTAGKSPPSARIAARSMTSPPDA
jgi:hypothetical protein